MNPYPRDPLPDGDPVEAPIVQAPLAGQPDFLVNQDQAVAETWQLIAQNAYSPDTARFAGLSSGG